MSPWMDPAARAAEAALPTCTECGVRPSRGAGMPHCVQCATTKRRTSIFSRLSAEELRVLRAAARPSTTTTEED
jgi:hypothetical protein